jgi:ATP-dependent RNA helicase DHX33
VDEAHERTLRTDLVLSALKNIQKERNVKPTDHKGKGPETARSGPLKIIIMSATLDAQKFSKFFNK